VSGMKTAGTLALKLKNQNKNPGPKQKPVKGAANAVVPAPLPQPAQAVVEAPRQDKEDNARGELKAHVIATMKQLANQVQPLVDNCLFCRISSSPAVEDMPKIYNIDSIQWNLMCKGCFITLGSIYRSSVEKQFAFGPRRGTGKVIMLTEVVHQNLPQLREKTVLHWNPNERPPIGAPPPPVYIDAVGFVNPELVNFETPAVPMMSYFNFVSLQVISLKSYWMGVALPRLDWKCFVHNYKSNGFNEYSVHEDMRPVGITNQQLKRKIVTRHGVTRKTSYRISNPLLVLFSLLSLLFFGSFYSGSSYDCVVPQRDFSIFPGSYSRKLGVIGMNDIELYNFCSLEFNYRNFEEAMGKIDPFNYNLDPVIVSTKTCDPDSELAKDGLIECDPDLANEEYVHFPANRSVNYSSPFVNDYLLALGSVPRNWSMIGIAKKSSAHRNLVETMLNTCKFMSLYHGQIENCTFVYHKFFVNFVYFVLFLSNLFLFIYVFIYYPNVKFCLNDISFNIDPLLALNLMDPRTLDPLLSHDQRTNRITTVAANMNVINFNPIDVLRNNHDRTMTQLLCSHALETSSKKFQDENFQLS